MTYQWIIGVISAVALAASLFLAQYGWGAKLEDGSRIKKVQTIIVIAWTLAPPLWFWFEFYFLRDRAICGPLTTGCWEEFKYGQEVSSRIWLATTSALLALYFWKDIRGK